jgi:ribokinase
MVKTPNSVAILGIYVADLAFEAGRLPVMGETIMGSGFRMGPGGKGSNQAVASARSGAHTTFISCLGRDDFATVAKATWAKDNIHLHVRESYTAPTGAAFIFVQEKTGANAIIVTPGTAATISVDDVDAAAHSIQTAEVFITQLEQPLAAAEHALRMARAARTRTIFNPAPAEAFPDSFYGLCDYITPNETEASAFTGVTVNSEASAREAADVFLSRGVGTALITLGSAGALLHNAKQSILVPAMNVGTVADTTGAGDAFNGGFAAAIASGASDKEAVQFGCAVAGISVTRPGTAASMPYRQEVLALLAKG